MKNYRQAKIVKADTGEGRKNCFIINNNGNTRAIINWNMNMLRERVDHLIDDLNAQIIDGIINIDADIADYCYVTIDTDLTQPA